MDGHSFAKHSIFVDDLTCRLDFRETHHAAGSTPEEVACAFQNIENVTIFQCPHPGFMRASEIALCFPKLRKLLLVRCVDLGSVRWSALGTLANLERLELNACPRLRSFPPEICQLQNLTECHLYGMPALESLPAEIVSMKRLESFVATSCKSLTVPEEVFSIPTLKRLRIENCWQVMVPARIGKLQDLEVLELKRCSRLSKNLPSDIGELKKLKHISLVSCYIHDFTPPTIRECSNSESIRPSIPSTVAKLKSLETLTLLENVDFINTLPCIPQLKSIHLINSENQPDGQITLCQTAWRESNSLETLIIHSFSLGKNFNIFLRSLPRTLRTLKVFSCSFAGGAKASIEALLNEDLPQGLRNLMLTLRPSDRREVSLYDLMDYVRKLLRKYEQLVSVRIDLATSIEWSAERCLTYSHEDNFLVNFNKCGRCLLKSTNHDGAGSLATGGIRAAKPSIPLSVWPTVLERVGRIMDRELLVTCWSEEVKAAIVFQLLQGPAFLSRASEIPRGAAHTNTGIASSRDGNVNDKKSGRRSLSPHPLGRDDSHRRNDTANAN